MRLDFNQLALLTLLATAVHYLVARSSIMQWFWDLRWWPIARARYRLPDLSPREPIRNQLREAFGNLLACAACSGFWLGLAGGVAGLEPIHYGHGSLINVLAGSTLCGVVLVPILEGVLLWGLTRSRIH